MGPTVYLDVLFFTNFITDFFLLVLTRRICKNKARVWRLLLGAVTGSVYSVFMFFPNISLLYSALCKLVVSAAIVLLSFRVRSIRDFVSLLVIFYLSSFALAGAAFGLFYFTSLGPKVGAAVSNGVFYVGVSPLVVLTAAALCYGVLHFAERLYTKRLAHCANMHKLRVSYGAKSVQMYALLDTANSMSDPVTNMPVIVCTIDAVKPLFQDKDFYARLCDVEKTDSDKIKVELVCDTPFRLVPFRALGTNGDVMLAFSPEGIEVDGRPYQRGALIGLCAKPLSQSPRYDALIHPRVMVNL